VTGRAHRPYVARFARVRLNGPGIDHLLQRTADGYVLETITADAVTRELLPAHDLRSAVASRSTVCDVGIGEMLEITVPDPDHVNDILEALNLVNPHAWEHSDAWDDDDASTFQEEDEELNHDGPPVAYVGTLLCRWVRINEVRYDAMVTAPGEARLVPTDGSSAVPRQPLISASWYSESGVTSFNGCSTIGYVGADLLLAINSGDVDSVDLHPVPDTADGLVDILATWLRENLLTLPFVLVHAPTPGLDQETRRTFENLLVDADGEIVHWLEPMTDERLAADILTRLSAGAPGGRLIAALGSPTSADGLIAYRILADFMENEDYGELHSALTEAFDLTN
jgi:hypothetical protein